MNKTFKTIWSDVRRSYVAASEASQTHGKPSKTAVALTIAAAALASSVATAAYVEQGRAGSIQSWQSSEYGKDGYIKNTRNQHGLLHINAATAYAEGLTGKGVTVGVVDSGALLAHTEHAGGRIFGVTAKGTYTKSGTRYPFADLGMPDQDIWPNGHFKKGEAFEVNGDWIKGHNDFHGTHVTSVVAANRDGEHSHGVAFEAKVAVGNTGGNDSMNYGPYPDYGYFYSVWDAVGAAGAKVINNSWGSNIRVGDPDVHFNVGDLNGGGDGSKGADPAVGTVAQPGGSEQEYFLFMKDARKNGGKNFMDAAYEIAVKYGLVQVFTNGNRQFQNPYYRGAYAYYNPEAEKYWIAAGAIDVDRDGNEEVMGYGEAYTGTGTAAKGKLAFNRAGFAKWWGIASPTNVLGAYVENDGTATNKERGGTSNAAPHITGVMAVLLQRFGSYMDVTQVRNVMFTTARQTQLNRPKELLPGITRTEAGAPEDDYGWGVIDLGKAVYGPGQFFGTFDVTMNGVDDQWDNTITDKAIQLRGKEDAAEKSALTKRIAELKAKTDRTDKEGWELQYKEKRLAAIEDREAQGYKGKLIKRGDGVLKLTAVNSYTGGTEIIGGTVAGLTESFGSGTVTVKNGGTIELHKSFAVTHAGQNNWETKRVKGTDNKTSDDAAIVLEDGALIALADAKLSAKSLTVNGEATVKITGLTQEMLADLWKSKDKAYSASITAKTVKIADPGKLKCSIDTSLFDSCSVSVSKDGKTITATLKTAEGK